MDELLKSSACDIVSRLKSNKLSPLDLLDVLEKRIGEVDGPVNALPTLCFDRARDTARALVKKPSTKRGLLAGMPLPIKDLTNVAGVRSTMGSPIFADAIPDTSDILVTHLERQGAVIYAKSNTPEFGAGGNTFNEVFGITRNPWDTQVSAAGSSGGSAAALACGMAWLAHGSDMGGSLRNPASFCGIVGLRPSPGRVAATQGNALGNLLGVEGPMARNIEDVALLFDAMLSENSADPISLPYDGRSHLSAVRQKWQPKKIAYSPDLGFMPIDPEVKAITTAAMAKFEQAGVIVEEVHPDFNDAHEAFRILRGLAFAIAMKPLLDNHRDKLKPEVVWNIEYGLKLTADDIIKAEHQRAHMFHRAQTFFTEYDAICCPATIVPPFPVEQRFVEKVGDHSFENYVEWLGIAYAFTLIASPALSMPVGRTVNGLPVGLQIATACRNERKLLATAHVLEGLLQLGPLTPIEPQIKHE